MLGLRASLQIAHRSPGQSWSRSLLWGCPGNCRAYSCKVVQVYCEAFWTLSLFANYISSAKRLESRRNECMVTVPSLLGTRLRSTPICLYQFSCNTIKRFSAGCWIFVPRKQRCGSSHVIQSQTKFAEAALRVLQCREKAPNWNTRCCSIRSNTTILQ